MKIRNYYDKDLRNSFKCCESGNGKKVPQYELVDGVIKPKLDKDGNQVFHSLYADIQKHKNVNDYKKIINQAGLENVSSAPDWKEQDLSDIGTFSELVAANAKVDSVLKENNVKDLTELAYKLFGNKTVVTSDDEVEQKQEQKITPQENK